MSTAGHWIFWFLWFVMVMITSLIFLNFIIAEVSNSYQKVKDDLDALMYKERAGLILEMENLTTNQELESNKESFPKFIVCRRMED